LLPLSWGSTRAGWTVGAGVEAALDRNWSVKLEYLYMDLGNVGGGSSSATAITNSLNTPGPGFNTVTTTTLAAAFNTRFTDNILRAGVNYRFGGPVVAKYWVSTGISTKSEPGLVPGFATRRSVATSSHHLVPLQRSNLVCVKSELDQNLLGLFAEFGRSRCPHWSARRGSTTWFFTARLIESPEALALGLLNEVDRQTRVGWTAARAWKKKFARNWSAKLEYLYLDLGTKTYFGGTAGAVDVRFQDHILRASITYQFTSGPAVAKYW
jgi:opacity protein-like surface antigen